MATWRVAIALMRGFALPDDVGLEILAEYSGRCKPPWSERELQHKIAQAAKANVPEGYLRDAESPRAKASNANGRANGSHAEGSDAPKRSGAIAPSEVIARWEEEGALIRIATGIAPLDDMCRGGLPIPWRAMLVGAPSAGKTALAIIIARGLVDAGVCVGILAVDEEPEDMTVRLVQLAGFTVAQAEQRDPATLRDMHADLEGLRVRLYDSTYTIESAAADLAAWSEAERTRGALVIDSLHAVDSDAAVRAKARDERARVTANVAAMRFVTTHNRLLTIATVEANRAAYRTEAAADETNDLAAGAETRAIEFGGQTQLMLRTPKDHPDVIHVRVAKNRRMQRGEFWLSLDRDRHTVRPCPDPSDCPEQRAEAAERQKRKNRAGVEADARVILDVASLHPGEGSRGLRDRLRAAGNKWGEMRLGAAMTAAKASVDGRRLVDRRPSGASANAPCQWHTEHLGEDSP